MTAGRRSASVARWFLEWFKSIAIALVVWLFLRTFVVEAFTIPSGSMKNTLLIGDFLFVNKFLYGAEVPFIHKHLPMVREPQRGDILVFDSIEEDMKMSPTRGSLLIAYGSSSAAPLRYTTPPRIAMVSPGIPIKRLTIFMSSSMESNTRMSPRCGSRTMGRCLWMNGTSAP